MKRIETKKVTRYENVEIYLCDYCGKELRDKEHFSMTFGGWSGLVKKQKDGKWKHIKNCITPYHEEKTKQFCPGVCMTFYFSRTK